MASCSSFLFLCLLAAVIVAASAQGGWQKGRATFYGIDGWSIHKGSCGLGYQYKNIGTGWDTTAIADASPEFAGSCGRCYEVRCDPRPVIDGYSNRFDRSGACKAGTASVVVRAVDNCPCKYPSNAYSNKRWCCGDNSGSQGTHFDLSIWAFEKLANTQMGVAGIEFRRVSCDYRPSNPAPEGPTKMPHYETPSALGYPGTPYAPDSTNELYSLKLVQRFDGPGAKQGAVNIAKDAKSKASATLTMQEMLDKHGSIFSSASASASVSGSAAASASASASSNSDNGCTDVAPKGSSCQQQKVNGRNYGQPAGAGARKCRTKATEACWLPLCGAGS